MHNVQISEYNRCERTCIIYLDCYKMIQNGYTNTKKYLKVNTYGITDY